ncbi:MAG TPA: hypothetical protein PKA53_10555, partial [Sphingobacterium sp.]|nr:hypothetical protein [Sphingobacterium sp.]
MFFSLEETTVFLMNINMATNLQHIIQKAPLLLLFIFLFFSCKKSDNTPTTKAGWRVVETATNHSLGIKDDGTLWGWGNNLDGQLGNGSIIEQNVPVQIGKDNDWKIISSGDDYTLGIKNDGTLWAWGENRDGKLGDGTTISKLVPTKISTDAWLHVSTGLSMSIGVKTDGTAWAWGGLSLFLNRPPGTVTTPTQLTELSDVKKCYNGGRYSVFLKNDGTIWGMGRAHDMCFGLGSSEMIDYYPLQQIGVKNDCLDMFNHSGSTIVLKRDGTLWAWGSQYISGRLGLGTNIIGDVGIPTQITNNVDGKVSTIVRTRTATYLLKEDGTLWGTGRGVLLG